MNQNTKIARMIIAKTILDTIERPRITWEQAELLAKLIQIELYHHDRFIVELPKSGKSVVFSHPEPVKSKGVRSARHMDES